MKNAIILLLVFLLSACGGDTLDVNSLTGKWRLASMDGQTTTGALRESGVTLEIQADGKFAGQAPVNRYFGQIRLEGKRIKTGPIGSTMMAGPPELMDAEQAFFRNLGENLQSATVQNKQLVLIAADGKKLVFDKSE
jgi:heat shock protein HslJ